MTGEREIAERHFLDSLAVLKAAGASINGARVIDVGSGAGFPGVPMKLVEPSISLTALDSTEKRVFFLRKVYEILGLISAEAIIARAEELSRLPGHAVRPLSACCGEANVLELCLPFGGSGYFFAMKTASSEEEIMEAETP